RWPPPDSPARIQSRTTPARSRRRSRSGRLGFAGWRARLRGNGGVRGRRAPVGFRATLGMTGASTGVGHETMGAEAFLPGSILMTAQGDTTTRPDTETGVTGIVLTDHAAAKVKALLEQEGRTDLALRVAVQPGGCS